MFISECFRLVRLVAHILPQPDNFVFVWLSLKHYSIIFVCVKFSAYYLHMYHTFFAVPAIKWWATIASVFIHLPWKATSPSFAWVKCATLNRNSIESAHTKHIKLWFRFFFARRGKETTWNLFCAHLLENWQMQNTKVVTDKQYYNVHMNGDIRLFTT